MLEVKIQFCTSIFTQEQLKYCINIIVIVLIQYSSAAGTERLALSVVITVISEGNLICVK